MNAPDQGVTAWLARLVINYRFIWIVRCLI
jgi:hypothetical protein